MELVKFSDVTDKIITIREHKALLDSDVAVLYGSRAKGNYNPFSDVDITLMGDITHNRLNRLSMDIDDLLLPYQFDISIFHTLANPDLIDHIQRVGITIYRKKGVIPTSTKKKGLHQRLLKY